LYIPALTAKSKRARAIAERVRQQGEIYLVVLNDLRKCFDGRAAMGTVETPEAYGAPPRKIASIWPPARRGPPYAPLAASRSSRIIGAGESGFTVLESFAGRLQRRGLVLIKLNIIRG